MTHFLYCHPEAFRPKDLPRMSTKHENPITSKVGFFVFDKTPKIWEGEVK